MSDYVDYVPKSKYYFKIINYYNTCSVYPPILWMGNEVAKVEVEVAVHSDFKVI